MPDPTALECEALSQLLDATRAINSSQELDRVLESIARAAQSVLSAEASGVLMRDAVRGKLRFAAATGPQAAALLGVEFDEKQGIAGRALRDAQTCIIDDVATDGEHYGAINRKADFTTRSLIAAPLIHRNRRLGVIEILNPRGREHFNETDRQLAELLAGLASVAIANAERVEALRRETESLRSQVPSDAEMIGDGPPVRRVRDLIRRVARTNSTVLLLGESGTGKELAARSIHALSDRAGNTLVPVNCAALTPTLLESELFGHEAGAFTGAIGRKLGHFELAHQGTIFLDEIGEMSGEVQTKLLRVLQEREIVRVGGSAPIGVDVRVVAATNRDLAAEVRAGRFREDLFYRLNVFPIELPPLRDRREDVPLLVEYFLGRLAAGLNLPRPHVAPQAMAALSRYGYPGNIRELQNLLERACLLAAGPDAGEHPTIELHHLPTLQAAAPAGGATIDAPAAEPGESKLAASEKQLITQALREHGGNVSAAARALGVHRDHIRYRIKKYGL